MAARNDGAQGRVALARRVADVAHLGRHFRGGAWRFDQCGLLLRSVRQPAGESRRRKLFHPACFRHARHVSRRTGESRRRRLGHDRNDFRLFDRQYGHDRHIHDSVDEAGRLFGREGRRNRSRGWGQRTTDAAGHGRGGVPDRGVCRHYLRRSRQARLPAGVPHLWRAILYRRYRGGQAGAARPATVVNRSDPPFTAARADDRLRHDHLERRRLLGHRLDQDCVRRRGNLGARRNAARSLCGAGPLQSEACGPCA